MTSSHPILSLREITRANPSAVEALTVTASQAGYVAGVPESLVEAAEEPDACPWYRAVYADDEHVGFVMVSDGITVVNPDYLGPYYLWRLLIDRRYQGHGHGSAALRLAVEHVRTRADARVLIISSGRARTRVWASTCGRDSGLPVRSIRASWCSSSTC